jgi:hypothetical protein
VDHRVIAPAMEFAGAGWFVAAGAPELDRAGPLAPEPSPPGALAGPSGTNSTMVSGEPAHAAKACIVAAAETT